MTDIDSPAIAKTLAPDDFYQYLTARNTGLIDNSLQRKIKSARILIAGCGSIGGATVIPLVRTGYMHFTLADPGSYELSNLNRQNATLDDLGRNKSEVMRETILSINPHAKVKTYHDGITTDNVKDILQDVDVIVDGVDVTTTLGLEAKWILHQKACDLGKQLITAWDMAGMLAIQYFDYRNIDSPFDGELSKEDVLSMNPWAAIFRIAPRRQIPSEMLFELKRGLCQNQYNVPQLPEAANQFGALASHVVNVLVDGNTPRKIIAVDTHRVSLPFKERMWKSATRPFAFLHFSSSMNPIDVFLGFSPKWVYKLTKTKHRKG